MPIAAFKKPESERLSPERLQEALAWARQNLSRHLLGLDAVVEISLATLLGGGHLLLEGAPGVGKTTLAKGLAQTFHAKFSRIQLTSDLLPSEIVGILRMHPETRELVFRPGPVFANFVLADELNRSSPKTQAALLEAMAEGTVTIDGVTHPLPVPFCVMATQNPAEHQGVFPLAESQLDRFMAHVEVGYPDLRAELAIYGGKFKQSPSAEEVEEPLSVETFVAFKEAARQVNVHQEVQSFVLEIVRQSRGHSELRAGVSVRGGVQFLDLARAFSYVRGRDFVTPRDIVELAPNALAHRLMLKDGGDDLGAKRSIIHEILRKIPQPQ